MADKFWSKRLYFISLAFCAGINFINGLQLTYLLGIQIFGLWMAIRSASQMFTGFGGIFNCSLLVLITKKKINNRTLLAIANTLSLLSLPIYIGIITVIYIIFRPFSNDFFLPSIVLTLGLILSGISGINNRAYREGKKLVFGNFADAFLGLIIMILIYINKNLILFIYMQSLRYYLKFFIQIDMNYIFNLNIKKKHILVMFKLGISIMLRNWLQMITQYGDKMLMALIFGYSISGALALGANFSLPIIMLLSSVFVFLLPVIIDLGDQDNMINKKLKDQFSELSKLSITLSFLVPVVALFIKDHINIFIIFSGYWISILVNLCQLLSMKYFNKDKIWRSTILLLLCFIANYSLIFSIELFLGKILSIELILFVSVLLLAIFVGIFFWYLSRIAIIMDIFILCLIISIQYLISYIGNKHWIIALSIVIGLITLLTLNQKYIRLIVSKFLLANK